MPSGLAAQWLFLKNEILVVKLEKIHTILYVENQLTSTNFYEKILGKHPDLCVPGMTEFKLSENFILGLMPNDGIAKILTDKTPHPKSGGKIPRCEIYLCIEDIEKTYLEIKKMNISLISPLMERNWGDRAFYFADPDGHIIAFAQKINTQ